MAITIGSYNFEGPFSNSNSLRAQSAVYAILGRNGESDRWIVVDIGEAGDACGRVANHDRADSWKRQGYRQLACAAHYCDERSRMLIEQELRKRFNPPCGDR
jgi:hypothetical protein